VGYRDFLEGENAAPTDLSYHEIKNFSDAVVGLVQIKTPSESIVEYCSEKLGTNYTPCRLIAMVVSSWTPATTVMLFLQKFGYSAADMINMGLQFEMFCSTATDWEIILDKTIFKVNEILIDKMRCSFINMMFAGVTIDMFVTAQYTLPELDILGFNAPVFMAAGGNSAHLSSLFPDGIDEQISARFSFCKEMCEFLGVEIQKKK
jgi:hypothetical protein